MPDYRWREMVCDNTAVFELLTSAPLTIREYGVLAGGHPVAASRQFSGSSNCLRNAGFGAKMGCSFAASKGPLHSQTVFRFDP